VEHWHAAALPAHVGAGVGQVWPGKSVAHTPHTQLLHVDPGQSPSTVQGLPTFAPPAQTHETMWHELFPPTQQD
jgi:hypothetical protein